MLCLVQFMNGIPQGHAVGRNLRELAKAKQCEVSDLVACILDRDRHKELIAKTREAGARQCASRRGAAALVRGSDPPSRVLASSPTLNGCSRHSVRTRWRAPAGSRRR